MKKNLMMRIAAVLMVCVLATTCGISGTFAKYVTSAETSDTARVAKWGVMLTVSGDGIFSEEYEAGNKTVISSNHDKLVAPGTKNETGITFTLKGQPEVAFQVKVGLGTTKDVFLEAGTYTDYTQLVKQADGSYAYSKTFTTDKVYNPVVFTLTHKYGAEAYSIKGAVTTETGATWAPAEAEGNMTVETVTGTLEQINKVLANLTANMTKVNPNYVLDDTFTLTWAWAFGDPANNAADTLLGNLAADTATVTGDNVYNLNLKYNFSITIEQVD